MIASSSLSSLCKRVAQWRAHRESPKSRVPEELWSEAVRVARIEGLYATAKAIRFNYESLKRRVNQESQELVVAEPETFVEFRLSASPEGPVDAKVVVELRGLGGEGMRIEGDGRALDLVGLARVLWRRES